MMKKVMAGVSACCLIFLAVSSGPAIAVPDSSAPAKSKKTKIKVETPKTDMFAYYEKKGGKLRPMPKKLKAGTYVFKYVNNTTMQHDLQIGSAKTKTKICSNCTEKLQVTLTKGKVKYKCTVPGHAQGGMKGKIKVKR